MALLTELQHILDTVLSALEQEDRNDLSGALSNYQQAHSQLRSAAELLLPDKCPALIRETLHALLGTYNSRTQVLAQRLSHDPAQQDSLCTHTSAPAACSANAMPSSSSHMIAIASTPGATHAIEAAAGADDDEEVGGVDAECGALTMLRRCQRETAGSLADVAGLEQVKQSLKLAIFLPNKLAHLFKGIRQPPRTFLLHGPPGTGKTLIVEKVAAEAQLTLLSVTPSSILSKWSGDSERALRAVFEAAKAVQPSIVFLDEIDSFARERSGGDDALSRRLLTELLLQMNSIAGEPDCQVYIFAATNRIQDCDPAVLRRFERRIHVPLPEPAARRAFVLSVLEQPDLQHSLTEEDIAHVVDLTDGYSCSDLSQVCQAAAMAPLAEVLERPEALALLDGIGIIDPENSGHRAHPALELRAISVSDFEDALQRICPAAQHQETT